MRQLFLLITFLTISVLSFSKPKPQSAPVLSYPKTEKIAHYDVYFGDTIQDPYQWLEDDTSAATAAWVQAQNKLTFGYLEQIPYRNALRDRFKEIFDYAKISAPIISGNTIIYTKKEGLQNQGVIYMQKGDAPAEILIDPNAIDPKGITVMEIDGASFSHNYDFGSSGISPDGKYAAITIQKAGSDWKEVQVYNLETKSPTGDKLQWLKSGGISWYKDGFFYARYPQPAAGTELTAKNELQSVYYHKLGTLQEQDELVFRDDKNPLVFNGCYTSEDGQYLFLYRFPGTYGNEIHWKKMSEPGWNFKPLFTGGLNEYSVIDVINDQFLVLTDDGASYKQLVAVDPQNPDKKNWKAIIPEQNGALLEGVYTSGHKLFAKYLEQASNRLYAFDIDGKNKQPIALPGNGMVLFSSARHTDKQVAFVYSSFNYPPSIFTYNIASGYANLFMKPTLKFNPDDYETKQVWYKSKDKTPVSMFIAHKKGLKLNGKNPTYLYGYGGFSQNMTPVFSASRILLMENGGVLAIPNLRGGAEYGEDWHKAGTKMQKQNVFDDFIAAAEYLIKEKYTSKDKLGIAGGSNGGLLVGACMTQRPELFKVALPAVGVMDMLKYHKFTVGWGWTPDYGSSADSPEMYRYLKGYSPYHTLKPGVSYPATMVTTADHDDRVVPAHSFKFAARLQEYHKGPNPVLIRISVNAGHGAGKPTSKIIEEVADNWAFFFWNLGIKTLPTFVK